MFGAAAAGSYGMSQWPFSLQAVLRWTKVMSHVSGQVSEHETPDSFSGTVSGSCEAPLSPRRSRMPREGDQAGVQKPFSHLPIQVITQFSHKIITYLITLLNLLNLYTLILYKFKFVTFFNAVFFLSFTFQ